MSKSDAYHAGYDAGVRDERKRCQEENARMMEQEAEIERLRNKLWEFNWYQHTGKPPWYYS